MLGDGERGGHAKTRRRRTRPSRRSSTRASRSAPPGKHDEAIAKFNEAIAIIPTCYNCYNNIGFSYTAKKDCANAETAYKKSIEVKPDDAAAYVGSRAFTSTPAKPPKRSRWSRRPSRSTRRNADAHYIYGMTLVAENPAKAKAEFEEFVKLAPTAPNAADRQAV